MFLFGFCSTAQAMPDWLTTSKYHQPFEIKLDEQNRQFRNTGTLTLRDPIFGITLGTYKIATGGFGRGSAPFGEYTIGRYRSSKDDDPKNIGKRWMITQYGQEDEGEAYDHKLKVRRNSLELHRLRFSNGTAGCIGVAVPPEKWDDFVKDINYIIAQAGKITFQLTGNPEAQPNDTWNPFGNIVYRSVKHAGRKYTKPHRSAYAHHQKRNRKEKYVSRKYGHHRRG